MILVKSNIMANIIKNYEKYSTNEAFKRLCSKIKLVKGKEEKQLDILVPTIVLFELDPEYFGSITSGQWKEKSLEVIEFGLDETYESFDGFEQFIKDYLKYNFFGGIPLPLTDKLNFEKLLSALHFNKCIYDLTNYTETIGKKVCDFYNTENDKTIKIQVYIKDKQILVDIQLLNAYKPTQLFKYVIKKLRSGLTLGQRDNLSLTHSNTHKSKKFCSIDFYDYYVDRKNIFFKSTDELIKTIDHTHQYKLKTVNNIELEIRCNMDEDEEDEYDYDEDEEEIVPYGLRNLYRLIITENEDKYKITIKHVNTITDFAITYETNDTHIGKSVNILSITDIFIEKYYTHIEFISPTYIKFIQKIE